MQIKVQNLSKVFRGVAVLSGIDMELKSGNIYGIVGKNGSGKTMLLRAIAGLIVPTEGTICVDGQQLHRDISFPPGTGILIEKPEFLGHLTAMQNLEYLAEIQGKITRETIADYMRLFDLDPDSKKVVRKFSQGMKQKVGIIQAIMENQQLLILDEPFNALDEKTVTLLRGLLLRYKEEGRLIILTSHHKEDIESLCDQTYTIVDGTIRT